MSQGEERSNMSQHEERSSMSQNVEELYNFVCRDTDLLVISNKVQSSVRDVVECLHLEETRREGIETSDNDDSKKIYSAFMAWSEQEKEKAVWGELIRCLNTLKDHKLSESVKEYLVTSPPGKPRGK